jgi:hypothetical protein
MHEPPGSFSSLTAEINRLRLKLDELERQAKREAGVTAGVWTINRPLQHTGELLGFFAATPQGQQPRPVTLAEVIEVLRKFGLVA